MEYPRFIPPENLRGRTNREWTRKEALAYFEWFKQNIDIRINGLFRYFNVSSNCSPEQLLLTLAEKIAMVLSDPEFSYTDDDGKPKPTHAGSAIAVDMGLLWATLIIEAADGKVQWEIMTNSKKNINYHMPILVGVGDNPGIDPVRASIANIYALLQDSSAINIWAREYEYHRDAAVHGTAYAWKKHNPEGYEKHLAGLKLYQESLTKAAERKAKKRK